jgi:uncharacterized protein (TIGR02145 family)
MKKNCAPVYALYGLLLFTLTLLSSCIWEETFPQATVETAQVSLISESTASCGGIIAADGGSAITSRGVCWSTSANPTIEDDTTFVKTEAPVFACTIKGLFPGTTYYVRAYAVNKGGVAYGLNVVFTTKTLAITTIPVSSITASSAISGGTILSDGNILSVTSRGVCWSTSPFPTVEHSKTSDGAGGGNYASSMDNLTESTTYYVRAYAVNSAGTAYGNELTFRTTNGVALLTTTAASYIMTNAATLGGTISSDGGAEITERGICWSTTPGPTISQNKVAGGNGTGSYTADITGLSQRTTYYARAYAVNRMGTFYGNEVSFTTLSSYGTVTDIEGNVYNYIAIGSQLWMVENLKTTKFNDGTPIPEVSEQSTWRFLTSPGYCNYNNDAANKDIYGVLYNGYAVNTGKLAPIGWHVPTDEEWVILTTYLKKNGYGFAGKETYIAKSMASKTGWTTSTAYGAVGNNPEVNNSSGFTGLPGGYRDRALTFAQNPRLGRFGGWWSSTVLSTVNLWGYYIYFDYNYVTRDYYPMNYGFSVRCIKDN